MRVARITPTPSAPFWLTLHRELSYRAIARICGVSDRTVRRWASGEDHPPLEQVVRVIDHLLPMGRHGLPIYRPDMAIDGGTRVGGVGEYTRRSARGVCC